MRPAPSASWPKWLRQKVRDFVSTCAAGPWPQMRDQAARLLAELPDESLLSPGPRRAAAAPSRGVDKSGLPFAPPPHPSQRDRKVVRNSAMNKLRWRVLGRAAGRCEFRCIEGGEPTEAHHVFGGADRIALESEYTLAAICEDCHGRCNASPAWAREQGLAWARRLEAAARAELAHGGSPRAIAAAEGFAATAEQLEARIALAAAQERRPA